MIFVDRSLPRAVADALNQLGRNIRWLDQVFPPSTADEVWLRQAGHAGWLVLSRDKRIRYRLGEIRAIREAGVGCFILTGSGDMTITECVALVEQTLPQMESLFAETPRRFIFTIGRSGRFARVPVRPEP